VEQGQANRIYGPDNIETMLIAGLQKCSLIDYPDRLAAVLFTQGCNFRCPYCHNPELIPRHGGTTQFDPESIFAFLEKRRGILEGVVITGGEPTLHEEVMNLCREIKGMGFAVKLDTNGSHPRMLARLLDENLIDFIAMDIKAPLDKYSQLAGVPVNVEAIHRSTTLLQASRLPVQFRTTFARPLLDENDILLIKRMIPQHKLHLQACRLETVLNPSIWAEYITPVCGASQPAITLPLELENHQDPAFVNSVN
jgi:pyruvate formate lyase activating enzyme